MIERHRRSMKMLSMNQPRPVRRNRDGRRLERARESHAGKLRARIRVENSRLAVPKKSVLQRRDAEAGVHPRVKSPRTFDSGQA